MAEQVGIWGWDDTNKVFVKVLVDSTGRLIIDPTAILENPPTEDEAAKAPTSEWAFDHEANPDAHHDAFTTADHTAIGDLIPHHAEAHTLASHTTKAHSELTGVGTSDHHIRYADTEAVTAMGAKADNNPLNHDRYTDTLALAAAIAGGMLIGKVVLKTADQIVKNSTVLVDDLHLKLTVAASEIWRIYLVLRYTSVGASGIKVAFTVPALATIKKQSAQSTGGAISSAEEADGTTAYSCGSSFAATLWAIHLVYLYIGGVNAGTAQLQWAQATAVNSDTTLRTNSYILAHKLA